MNNQITFYDPNLSVKITELASKQLELIDRQLRENDITLFQDTPDMKIPVFIGRNKSNYRIKWKV